MANIWMFLFFLLLVVVTVNTKLVGFCFNRTKTFDLKTFGCERFYHVYNVSTQGDCPGPRLSPPATVHADHCWRNTTAESILNVISQRAGCPARRNCNGMFIFQGPGDRRLDGACSQCYASPDVRCTFDYQLWLHYRCDGESLEPEVLITTTLPPPTTRTPPPPTRRTAATTTETSFTVLMTTAHTGEADPAVPVYIALGAVAGVLLVVVVVMSFGFGIKLSRKSHNQYITPPSNQSSEVRYISAGSDIKTADTSGRSSERRGSDGSGENHGYDDDYQSISDSDVISLTNDPPRYHDVSGAGKYNNMDVMADKQTIFHKRKEISGKSQFSGDCEDSIVVENYLYQSEECKRF